MQHVQESARQDCIDNMHLSSNEEMKSRGTIAESGMRTPGKKKMAHRPPQGDQQPRARGDGPWPESGWPHQNWLP
jgi:hypothetical protein